VTSFFHVTSVLHCFMTESTELVSIWFVFFSSICLSTYMFFTFILVFTFELKTSVLILNTVTVFQACERGTIFKLRVYERATVKNSESM